jgi:hypothetical protein
MRDATAVEASVMEDRVVILADGHELAAPLA